MPKVNDAEYGREYLNDEGYFSRSNEGCSVVVISSDLSCPLRRNETKIVLLEQSLACRSPSVALTQSSRV